MSELALSKEELKRKAFLVKCKDKEALRVWVKTYLRVDLPTGTVDPVSNSSPLDLLWEVYTAMETGNPDTTRFLFYAARDSGKCVEKGTLLLSKRGLIPVEEVTLDDTVWTGWNWRKVTATVHDGVKESVRVTLANGVSLTTSTVHRVWAWSPHQEPTWKTVSQLTSSDLVCTDISSDLWTQSIDESEYEIGYLCGILSGDGCLTTMDKYRLVTLSSGDSEVLSFWKKICLKYVGREPTQSKSRPYDWHISSKAFCAFLKSLGLKNAYSYEKEVPSRCMANRSVMAGFLSGLSDTDGSVTGKNTFELSLTARRMIEQVSQMLFALGVENDVLYGTKLRGLQRHLVHILTVNQSDFDDLARAGIVIKAFKKNGSSVPQVEVQDAHDSVPVEHLSWLISKTNVCGGRYTNRKGFKPKGVGAYPTVTRVKSRELLSWASDNDLVSAEEKKRWEEHLSRKWHRVLSVVGGTADFYDLTVEHDHSYWSAGVISHNTLSASILELLAALHFKRNVAHLAAVLSQSQVCAQYIKQYTNLPILRDYVSKDSERTIQFTRYYNPLTDETISLADWKALPAVEKEQCVEHTNWIKILVATMQGTNSTHSELLTIDELDIAPPGPIEEAKMIPTQCRDGKPPIVLMTSSRKFGSGFPVQDEIDNAEDRGTIVRHWNLIDVTNSCPESRCLASEPMVPIYYSDESLKRISEEEYNMMNVDQRRGFERDMGYKGCLTNCRLFAACRGRLARRPPSNCRFLKPIHHVQQLFRSVDLDKAKAQLLCWKPSAYGRIYPHFDPAVHVLTAQQIAHMITGDSTIGNITKAELLALCKEQGLPFFSGMDHGYTHDFATVTGVKDGNRMFILDVISEPELELAQKIEVCERKLKALDPAIFADPEDPASNKTLGRHFRMKEWTKGPGSVVAGISIVRFKLMPTMGVLPQLFFLKDDKEVAKLIGDMQKYHWALDADGEPTDKPDEVIGLEDGKQIGDDRCDALRYLVMNVFPPKRAGGISVSVESPASPVQQKQYTAQNWMSTVIAEHTGAPSIVVEEPTGEVRGKKGSLFWSL